MLFELVNLKRQRKKGEYFVCLWYFEVPNEVPNLNFGWLIQLQESSQLCIQMDSDGFRPDEVESENVEESGKPFVFGLPGAPLFLFTKDPLPCAPIPTTSMPLLVSQQETICLVANRLKEKMRLFLRPAVLLLFAASAIRMGAGLCFAYNNQVSNCAPVMPVLLLVLLWLWLLLVLRVV